MKCWVTAVRRGAGAAGASCRRARSRRRRGRRTRRPRRPARPPTGVEPGPRPGPVGEGAAGHRRRPDRPDGLVVQRAGTPQPGVGRGEVQVERRAGGEGAGRQQGDLVSGQRDDVVQRSGGDAQGDPGHRQGHQGRGGYPHDREVDARLARHRVARPLRRHPHPSARTCWLPVPRSPLTCQVSSTTSPAGGRPPAACRAGHRPGDLQAVEPHPGRVLHTGDEAPPPGHPEPVGPRPRRSRSG